MILQALNELYDRLAADPSYEIAPPGFSPQKISFRIVLKPDGTLFNIEDARNKNDKGKFEASRFEVPFHEKRTSGIRSQFLCDKPEYVLGWTEDKNKQAMANKCFEAFKIFHLEKESDINCPAYSAVCRFIEKWTPDQAVKYPILDEIGANFGIFSLQGIPKPVHEEPSIKKWWRERRLVTSAGTFRGQCLISGDESEICRIHPDIKGFKSSIALVGIQENTSYESYGLVKTENCPVSIDVAFRYSTALNALTDGPKKNRHRTRIANTTVLYWTETATIFEDFLSKIFNETSKPEDEVQDTSKLAELNRLYEALRSGVTNADSVFSKTNFFILGMEQPNPGRFSIRFFHRSSIQDLVTNLYRHHSCLQMIKSNNELTRRFRPMPEFPSIFHILEETARGVDEISPLLSGALTRSIVEGTAYPEGLFAAIIRRIHADRTINYLRAATLKAVLVRNHKLSIPTMLDQTNTDPAYLHGRLFAVLEKIQEQGHYAQTQQQLKSSIKEKYFSSACATPATVFPRLETLSVHHQRHLNSKRKTHFETLIGEIKWSLDGTKRIHTLVEQGIFILGYYHQRKALFESAPSETPRIDAELDLI